MKRIVLLLLVLCMLPIVSCTPEPKADPVIFGEIVTLVDGEALFYGIPIGTSSADVQKAFPDWQVYTSDGPSYKTEQALELSRTFMGTDMRVVFLFDPKGTASEEDLSRS